MAGAIHFELTETNQQLNQNFNSRGCDISRAFGFSAQAIWSGDAKGLIRFQVSNERVDYAHQVQHWDDLQGSFPIDSSMGYSRTIEFVSTHAKWVRAVFIRESGNGAIAITLHGKG
jgi:hypothetical protein